MLKIKKTTVHTDWDSTTEEILCFENWDEFEKHFWQGYVRELRENGHFTIHYSTSGDPRMADTWNGYQTYELVD